LLFRGVPNLRPPRRRESPAPPPNSIQLYSIHCAPAVAEKMRIATVRGIERGTWICCVRAAERCSFPERCSFQITNQCMLIRRFSQGRRPKLRRHRFLCVQDCFVRYVLSFIMARWLAVYSCSQNKGQRMLLSHFPNQCIARNLLLESSTHFCSHFSYVFYGCGWFLKICKLLSWMRRARGLTCILVRKVRKSNKQWSVLFLIPLQFCF